MIWCFVALVLKRIRRITEESFASRKAKRAVPSSRAETETCLNKGKFLGLAANVVKYVELFSD